MSSDSGATGALPAPGRRRSDRQPPPRPPARRAAPLRVAPAAALGLVVLAVTLWARAPVGAGVYYDDGIYLALARSLAEGEGYRYANLPGDLPGVKYPPLYPLALASGWAWLGPYPGSLPALKAMNAVAWAGAAACFFLLFAGRGRPRGIAAAAATAFGFLAVPSLAIATTLLSEPLFLLLAGASLLAAGRARAGSEAGVTGPGREAEVVAGAAGPEGEPEVGAGVAGAGRGADIGGRLPRRAAGWWLAAGGLAAGAFLTRSIGLSLVGALALAALVDGRASRRWRLAAAGLVTALPAAAAAAWFAWTSAAGDRIPHVISGHYGAYAGWYLAGLGDALAGLAHALGEAGAALVSSLRLLWAPGAPALAAAVILLILGGAVLVGAAAALQRNPAVPLFALLYLALAFVWPYDPDRFLWTIHPLLTLLAVEGMVAALPALRRDLPRAGPPLAAVGLAFLAANTLRYELEGYARRAWELAQRAPAAAFDPLVEWIRENTPPEAVIASRLDPYVYWQTGRRAVPSWTFRPGDYRREERQPAVLAAEMEEIRRALAPDYVAVVRGENKAWLTAAAYADRHPERIEAVFAAEEAEPSGVVYRLLGGGAGRERDGRERAGAPTTLTPPTPR